MLFKNLIIHVLLQLLLVFSYNYAFSYAAPAVFINKNPEEHIISERTAANERYLDAEQAATKTANHLAYLIANSASAEVIDNARIAANLSRAQADELMRAMDVNNSEEEDEEEVEKNTSGMTQAISSEVQSTDPAHPTPAIVDQSTEESQSNVSVTPIEKTIPSTAVDDKIIEEVQSDKEAVVPMNFVNVEHFVVHGGDDIDFSSVSSLIGYSVDLTNVTLLGLTPMPGVESSFVLSFNDVAGPLTLNNAKIDIDITGNFTVGEVNLSNGSRILAESAASFSAGNLFMRGNSTINVVKNSVGSFFKAENIFLSDSTLSTRSATFIASNITLFNSAILSYVATNNLTLDTLSLNDSTFETKNTAVLSKNLSFAGNNNKLQGNHSVHAMNFTSMGENNNISGIEIIAPHFRYVNIDLTYATVALKNTQTLLYESADNISEELSTIKLTNSTLTSPATSVTTRNIRADNSSLRLASAITTEMEKILLSNQSVLTIASDLNPGGTSFTAKDISLNGRSNLTVNTSNFITGNISAISSDIVIQYANISTIENISLYNNASLFFGLGRPAGDSRFIVENILLDNTAALSIDSEVITASSISSVGSSSIAFRNLTTGTINGDINIDNSTLTIISKPISAENSSITANALIMKNNASLTTDSSVVTFANIDSVGSSFNATALKGISRLGDINLDQASITLVNATDSASVKANDIKLVNSSLSSNLLTFTANNMNLTNSTFSSEATNELNLTNIILNRSTLSIEKADRLLAKEVNISNNSSIIAKELKLLSTDNLVVDNSTVDFAKASSFTAKRIALNNNSTLLAHASVISMPFENLTLGSSVLHFTDASQITANTLNIGSGTSSILQKNGGLTITSNANISGILNVNGFTFTPTENTTGIINIVLSEHKPFDVNNLGSSITSGIQSNGAISIANNSVLEINTSSFESKGVLRIGDVKQIELMHARTGGISNDASDTTTVNSWIGGKTKVICQNNICNNSSPSSLVLEISRILSYEAALNQEYTNNNKTASAELLKLAKLIDYGVSQGEFANNTYITANLGDLYNDIDYKVLGKTLEEKINSLRPISNDVYIFDIHEKTNTLRSIAKKHVSGKTSNKDVWLSIDYAIGSFTDGFLSRNTAAKKSNSNTAYLSSGFEVGDFNGAISVYKSNFKNKNVYDVDGTGIGVMADYTKKFFSIYGSYNTSMYKAQRHDIMGNTALSKPKVQEFSLGVDLIYAKEGFLPFGAADTKSTAKTKKGLMMAVTPTSESMFSNTHHMGVSLGFITTAGVDEKVSPNNNETNAGLLNKVAATTAFVPEAYYSYTLKAAIDLKSGVIEPFISLSGGYSAYFMNSTSAVASEIYSGGDFISYSKSNNSTPFGKAELGVDYTDNNISTGIASNIKITTISTNVLSSVYFKYNF